MGTADSADGSRRRDARAAGEKPDLLPDVAFVVMRTTRDLLAEYSSSAARAIGRPPNEPQSDSVRHESWNRHRGENAARGAAEDEFTQP